MAKTEPTRTCCIEGCISTSPRIVRAMCPMHYQRFLKDGTAGEASARIIPALIQDGMKLCRGCGQRKPLDLFHRQAASRTGASHYCKSCGSQRSREARESDPLFAERRRAYRSANAEKLRDSARNRYRADPLRAKVSTWRNQGIEMTAEQYRAMHADQEGACAICRKTEAQNGKALAVDHDHETGRVRGLLCDHCNIALGRFQDSPENLRRALDYLGA